MSKNSIPRWNLDSIFPSLNSKKYKDALSEFTSGMKNLENFIDSASMMMKNSPDNFDFPIWLKSYLDSENAVSKIGRTLGTYSYLVYSVDTTNTEYLNNIAKIQELSLQFEQIEISFQQLLRANSAKLDEFFKRFPEYEEFRYLLNESLADLAHKMSPKLENLASDLQRTGGDAWSRLHEQIISNLKDSSGKTFNEIRNDAYSADADLRKKSYETEIALLKQNEIAFAACLNNIKGATVALNKRRGWKNAVERALFANRLSEKSLAALVGAIEDSLPEWRKYFQKKAEYLRKNGMTASETAGTESNKGLAFYDLFAPVGSASENEKSLLSKKWTFDEAKEYVVERYNSFSKEMGDFARNAFEKEWIDAEVRAGKVGGAYDEDFALNHESRILTNFTGAFSDIVTLAHELGHAYHFSCLKGKPCAFFSYPMTLAETASTFAETIVKQDMISKCTGNEKMQILDLDLQDTAQTLVDILSRFYFERSVFEERTDNELNSADFCRLMKAAQEKSYGDGLSLDERHEYIWAVKSHYYSPDLDFYNYPYAFGQLFGAGLYALYQKEGSAFAKRYSELLGRTGSMSCEELCNLAGFDIESKDFWKSGIDMYIREIEEFVKLV
ncbi:MAG: M3 family oligoendopeptidase [Treponema sp.]|nr:M3 family oligoendopeptidase [Treponema sp.]